MSEIPQDDKGKGASTGDLVNSESSIAIDGDEFGDIRRLRAMGYDQELSRSFESINAIAFGVSSVAVVSTVASLFPVMIATGGPGMVFWTWILASVCTIVTAASLAETSSAYPSSGSVYHWAGTLAKKNGPLLSFSTGWLNLIGNAAGEAFFAQQFGAQAQLLYTMLLPNSTSFNTTSDVVGMGLLACVVCAIISLLPITQQRFYNLVGAILQILTAAFFFITPLITCFASKKLSSMGTVLGDYYDGTVADGQSSVFLVVLLAFNNPSFALTGYEASGHMAEETKKASKRSAIGIFYTAVWSSVIGFVFVLGLLIGLGDAAVNIGGYTNISMVQPVYIATSCINDPTSFTNAAVFLQTFLMISTFFAGFSSMTATSRILFAMSRDGAFPMSPLFRYVHPQTKIPVGSIILVLLFDSLIMVIYLGSQTAFNAVSTVSTVGYQLSYFIPMMLKVIARERLPFGEFHLGRWGTKIFGFIACVFLMITSLVSFIPTSYPVTPLNMNYTAVALSSFALVGAAFWIFCASQWFTGPKRIDDRIMKKLGVGLE